MTRISDGIFQRFPKLNDTEISTNLTTIRLSSNQIHTIEDYAFDGLTKLEYLFLDQNALTHIQRNTFSGGSSSIFLLHLANTQIETIEDGAFDFPKLQNLFIIIIIIIRS